MAWMTASAVGEGDFGTNSKPEEYGLGSTSATGPVCQGKDVPATGSGCSDGSNAGGGGDSPSAGFADAAGPPVMMMMILPPSYLYPIPNNAVGATEGSLVGDGMESGVRERAGEFFASESLAAHLWGRSWQGKNGKPKS